MSRHPVLKFFERLLILGGTAALAWCGYVLSSGMLYQSLAKETLRENPPVSSPVPAPDAHPRVHVIPAGTPVAELDIPRLHVSEAVFEGTDEDTLRKGPGHIEYTAWPGEPGNTGIAGHRDTFFRALRDAKIGDDVLLYTHAGRTLYHVVETRIVKPTDVSVLDPTSESALTLITCYPFSFLGSAPLRYVLRAVRVDPDANRLSIGQIIGGPHQLGAERPSTLVD